ncbi:MAG: MFS transporter [Blautia sp.]|jgi:MFS family permease
MNSKNGFTKDFWLVVIGQIISLFGNGVVRFALPLHLLGVTGSAALLGLVSGCAFLPLAFMTPLGGLIADRVNKRNIMVILDFFTAALVVLFLVLYGKVNLVGLILVMLFLLYGISGAYQPSVQASIPMLVSEDRIMSGNAAINMVSSLSGLLGPALGGIAYSAWGILPVLKVCAGCFFASAVMEIFIHIPIVKRERKTSLLKEAGEDLKESIVFIVKKNPAVGRLTICSACINFFLSALIIIGMPVVVMQTLAFDSQKASLLYGLMQALLAAGGLAGGLFAGVFASRLKMDFVWKSLFLCAFLLIPMGVALMLPLSPYVAFVMIAAAGMASMAIASICSIQIMSYIQLTTPSHLIGKVIAWMIALSTCAQPAGQIVYGFLFETFADTVGWLFAGAAVFSLGVACYSRKVVDQLPEVDRAVTAAVYS